MAAPRDERIGLLRDSISSYLKTWLVNHILVSDKAYAAFLRAFFEVDRRWVVVAALKALADDGEIPSRRVAEAIARYGIDDKKPNPLSV